MRRGLLKNISKNLIPELSQQKSKEDIKITTNSGSESKKLFEKTKTNKILYF